MSVSRAPTESGSKRSESVSNRTEPLVSVVLPTYNRAHVLEAAIESALQQTYDRLELVVVDGGSTDGTDDLVASIDDSRVRYRRRENPAGVSAARNTGIDAGEADLVAFIDSDDRWHPEKLARQVAAFRAGGPDLGVVYCGLDKADGEPRTRSGASGDVEEEIRTMAVPTYTSTLVIRRCALESVGGFDEALGCFEDWELCLRVAREWRFRYVDAPLVEKGSGEDNLSAEPDRLASAIDRLRHRYDLPAETLGRLLADAGRTYCEAALFGEGRPALVRALERHPRQPTTALALAASIVGSERLYDATMAAAYAARRVGHRARG